MKPENNETTEQAEVKLENNLKKQLMTVTPLSKYLALVLFFVLPFLGIWVGYKNAPEKIVEVENVIIKEVIKYVDIPVEMSSSIKQETDHKNISLDEMHKIEAVVNVPDDFKRILLNDYNRPMSGGNVQYESEKYTLSIWENPPAAGLGLADTVKTTTVATVGGREVKVEVMLQNTDTNNPSLYFVVDPEDGATNNWYYVRLMCVAETCLVEDMESVFDKVISGLELK